VAAVLMILVANRCAGMLHAVTCLLGSSIAAGDVLTTLVSLMLTVSPSRRPRAVMG